MSKVTATVLYPISVSFETDEQSPDLIWCKIIQNADKELANGAKTLAPVIYDCSIQGIVDLNPPKQNALDSQSDWVNATVKALSDAKTALQPAVHASHLLKPSVANKVLELQQILQDTLFEIVSHKS